MCVVCIVSFLLPEDQGTLPSTRRAPGWTTLASTSALIDLQGLGDELKE